MSLDSEEHRQIEQAEEEAKHNRESKESITVYWWAKVRASLYAAHVDTSYLTAY